MFLKVGYFVNIHPGLFLNDVNFLLFSIVTMLKLVQQCFIFDCGEAKNSSYQANVSGFICNKGYVWENPTFRVASGVFPADVLLNICSHIFMIFSSGIQI